MNRRRRSLEGCETPRQGIRCLLPPDQIFPAAKCGEGGARS